jgi:hypothetical protein
VATSIMAARGLRSTSPFALSTTSRKSSSSFGIEAKRIMTMHHKKAIEIFAMSTGGLCRCLWRSRRCFGGTTATIIELIQLNSGYFNDR